MSQEVLADASGLHRTAIGFIERGERNITFTTLLAVAKGLGTSVSQLLSGIEKEIGAPAEKRRTVKKVF